MADVEEVASAAGASFEDNPPERQEEPEIDFEKELEESMNRHQQSQPLLEPEPPVVDLDKTEMIEVDDAASLIGAGTPPRGSICTVAVGALADTEEDRYLCTICKLVFPKSMSVNAGSKKFPSWRCKDHHAAIKRLDFQVDADNKAAWTKFKRNSRDEYIEKVIEDAAKNREGICSRGENRKFMSELKHILEAKEQHKLKWMDKMEFLAWAVYKQYRNDEEARAWWNVVVNDKNYHQMTINGELKVGIPTGLAHLMSRSVNASKGVVETGAPINTDAQIRTAKQQMDDLLRANVTGGAFRGVGGGYFAIGGPEALEKEDERKRSLEEEGDLLNFGHKRARTDDQFKAERVQNDVLVRRQQLNTKWKDFEKHLGALHKRFGTAVKAKMYQEARNKLDLKWHYEDGVAAVKEACAKAKEQQSLSFENLDDLEARLPDMIDAFQREKDKMVIMEENAKSCEIQVANYRRTATQDRRRLSLAETKKGVEAMEAVMPQRYPQILKFELATAHSMVDDGTGNVRGMGMIAERIYEIPHMVPMEPDAFRKTFHDKWVRAATPELAKLSGIAQKMESEGKEYTAAMQSFRVEARQQDLQGFLHEVDIVGLEGFARPWAALFMKRQAYTPGQLPPFNGCGGYLHVAGGAVVVMVYYGLYADKLDTGIMGFLDQLDKQGYKRLLGMTRGIFFVGFPEKPGDEWVWIPPGFQFFLLQWGPKVELIFQPILLPNEMVKIPHIGKLMSSNLQRAKPMKGKRAWKHMDELQFEDFQLRGIQPQESAPPPSDSQISLGSNNTT